MKHKPALSSAKPVTSRRKVAGRPKKGPMALSKVDDKTECMGCPGSSFPSPAIAKKRVPSNVPINKEAASNMTQSQANHSKSKFLFVIAILFISIYIYTRPVHTLGEGGAPGTWRVHPYTIWSYINYMYIFFVVLTRSRFIQRISEGTLDFAKNTETTLWCKHRAYWEQLRQVLVNNRAHLIPSKNVTIWVVTATR